jgi:uncharacterized membrane protein YhaH (DUF805 family)
MQNRNPYAPPRANVANVDSDDEEYGEVNILTAGGRLGRVRYIGYTFGLTLLFGIIVGVIGAVMGNNESLLAVVGGVGYIVLFFISILLTIQRAHDMNSSGWLAILLLIPLVNLIFWVVPGTNGENTYGKKPPPNTTGVVLLACLLPLIFVLGIVAAIAIPAYQDYVQRAQISQPQ